LSLGWLGGCSASHTPQENSRPTLLKHPRDNPSRPTGGVAAPAATRKALSRKKTGADALGRPLRAWGTRRWAHTPPARPLRGAASARVQGGGWPNHPRA